MHRPGIVFYIVDLAYKTAQERFRNYNPIVLGLKKSTLLYRDFFYRKSSRRSLEVDLYGRLNQSLDSTWLKLRTF